MIDLFDDFRDMLVALVDAKADFVLIGGHAVAFHGQPRATKDSRIDGLTFDEASRASHVLVIDGRNVPVIAREPLIRNGTRSWSSASRRREQGG